ncbi:hypothetical protein [Parabacteroides sp. PF5-9]|uniref:hypothetical protein n=1 Tax=Parabacteroides sp. PF5-9 TaxID=1742404 RepID=UPI00247707CF|nr:hypothetical protein [Parabacteroides sp. PF5-9]MDH6357245.1 hypothetical protein [Parabacteroides sp. PF5-9]
MELKIYKQNGDVRAVVSPSDSATQQLGVMEENVLSLSFVLYEFIMLEVNDYVDFEGFRYTLTGDYRPEQKSTIEYKYEVRFYGAEDVTKDTLVLKMVDGDNSAEFSLTDTARVHAQLIVDNLNRKEGRNVWVVGEVIDTGVYEVVYSKTSCFDGLTKAAEGAETEWWIEGYSVNISRCEHGKAIELEYNKGLISLSKSENTNARFFTRLYPLGSTRNIDKAKYGHARLQLPGGAEYIERNTHLGIKEQGEESAFSHIYPRRIGYVDTVRQEERTGEDGEKYTVYFFTDKALNFDPNSYEIGGLVKRIVFEDGSLNGRDFDVNFSSKDKEFEIITQFPFDNLQLPGGALIPKKGDPYVLYNITMPDEYYPLAETEYQEAVEKYIENFSVDVSIYKAATDYVYFLEKGIVLKLGSRVRLHSKEYFAEGYRDSRIIRITRKVNNPQEINIECSHAVAVGRLTQIENSLVNVEAAIKSPTGGSNVQILRTWDSADPTDYNVFSALRTLYEIRGVIGEMSDRFIRKDIPDEAHGLITFNAGICTPGFVEGFTAVGKGMKVYDNGNVTLMELRARKSSLFGASLSSETFVSGFPNGTGWMLADYTRKNAAGVEEKKYKLELDDLTVRGNFRVYEMVISQLLGENDNRIFAGMMKIDHIDEETNTIYLDTDEGVLYNPFRSDDILMVQRFGGLPTPENDYQVIKNYELKVSEAGIGDLIEKEKRLDYIRFDTFVGDISTVAAGDVLVRVDNLTNSTRKGIMKITTIDEFGAPYLDVIYGMKTDLENSTKVRLGNLEGLVTPYWGRLEGWGLMATHTYLKGRFILQTGEDVLTKFEITEGLIKSEIASVRMEIQEKDNYLSNSSFTKDTDMWEAMSDIRLFTISARFLYFNENFYSDKKSVAAIVTEGDRRALRLKNAGVKQYNKDLAKKPEKPLDIEDEDKEKEVWPTFYISFRYKCVKAGTLEIGFRGEDCFFTEEIEPTDAYLSKEFSGEWDGEGDFEIRFSGDIYIYSLALADNPLENFKIETFTRFYQTDTKIGLLAQKTDKMQGTITTLGIDLDALEETVTLYAKKTDSINQTVLSLGIQLNAADESIRIWASKTNSLDGTVRQLGIDLSIVSNSLTLYAKEKDITGAWIVGRINISPSTVKIEAKNIQLEGKVSFTMLDWQVQSLMNSYVQSHNLGSLAYYSKVEQAMKDETLIVGGFIKTSLISVNEIFAQQATIGQFKINGGYLQWQDYYGDGATLVLGFNSWYANSCIAVRAGFFGNGVSSIAAKGGAAFFGSMYSSPSYPNTGYLYAAFFDGDLVMTRGNIIVRSGGVSGKGVIQADEMLPQNGFSGSMKGKSMEFKNGILIRAW